ncbi:MAG TPA: hypothetical protein VFW87_04945 [Pirellulales bacterium]|nr:hypothetical protein [Pirellulales bacterium]
MKVLFGVTATICSILALLHWAGIFVVGLSLYCGFIGILVAGALPNVRYGAGCFGLVLITVLTTLLDLGMPVIVSLRGVLGASAVGISYIAPLVYRSRWRAWSAALAIYVCWLLFLSRAPWDPRKPFWRAYDSIEFGMTPTEVEEQFRQQFGDRLPDRRHAVNRWWFYLDSNDGRYNAEFIEIIFIDGRVVDANYLPD